MEQIVLGIFIACSVLSACLLLKEYKHVQKERLLMEKYRNSNSYQMIYEFVREARRMEIDQVRIENDRILFVGLPPEGVLFDYRLPYVGRSLYGAHARILAEVLGEDIPFLKSYKYLLTRYRIVKPNRTVEYGYTYTLRSKYKTEMLYVKNYASV